MTFSKDYASTISPFVEQFKASKNEKARKAVLKNAAKAVSDSRHSLEDEGVNLPKDLEKAIERYIKKCIEKESNDEVEVPKPKKVKQFYTVRDVIKQKYRPLIEEQIPYKPNDKKYLGSYQIAVSTVQNNMTEKELEAARETAELWSEEGAPPEVQLKRAKTKLPNEIQKKVDEWKFSSGALVMCLVAFSDGQDVQTFHVESSPTLGNLFTQSHSDWREGTYDNFKDWSIRQFGLKELESGDEADVPVHFQKAKDLSFEKNSRGELVLPPMHNYRTVRQKQRVIRGYVGAVYREFTGSQSSAFPYILASQKDQKIYSKDCVPADFTLSDPDHTKSSNINALYSHWLRRQTKGLPPLVFLGSGSNQETSLKKSANSKGKKKAVYVHVSDDNSPGDDDDDDDDEDDDDRNDDEDESRNQDDRPATKFGPPSRKRNKVPPATQRNQVDGPSFQPTLQPVPHPNRPIPGPSFQPTPRHIPIGKNAKSKKRPAEDELVADVLPKIQKTGAVRKSSRVAAETKVVNPKKNERGEKRPLEDGRGSKSKRSRHKESNPDASPQRCGARNRLKDFPAGNSATSASRMTFLKSLCSLPKFSSLVDLIPPVPKPSVIPKKYPSWVSWTGRNVYLPAEIHSHSSFKSNLSLLRKDLADSALVEAGKIDGPLLLFGLLYREVSRSIEAEPDDPTTNVPSHLINSPFGIKQLTEMEKLVNDVQIDDL